MPHAAPDDAGADRLAEEALEEAEREGVVAPLERAGAEREAMARLSRPAGGEDEKTGLAPGTRRGGDDDVVPSCSFGRVPDLREAMASSRCLPACVSIACRRSARDASIPKRFSFENGTDWVSVLFSHARVDRKSVSSSVLATSMSG